MWGTELVVMALMIGVNSIFAAYEIALASVNPARLRHLAEQGRRGAAVASEMKENIEGSLAVVQLGITLVGAIAAAVGGAGAEESVAPILAARFGVSESTSEWVAIALVVAPLTAVTIIVGELIPKVFALRNAERVCLALSLPMRIFSRSVWPAVWFFETVVTGVMSWGERGAGTDRGGAPRTTELQDLRAAAAVARASRLIGQREERIILGASEMATRKIREIMIPAEDISFLDAGASLTDNLIRAHLDMHTRFPVVERPGDPQSVIGYANFKDIVATLRFHREGASFRDIVRPIPSVAADQTLGASLEQLMRQHTHIALARGHDDRVLGMITLEDLLEELVGEIEDEYDRLPAHLAGAGTSWIAGGGVPLERLREVTELDLTGGASDAGTKTLARWVEDKLGDEIRGGEVVEDAGVRLTVRKVRRKKLLEGHLVRIHAGSSPDRPAPE